MVFSRFTAASACAASWATTASLKPALDYNIYLLTVLELHSVDIENDYDATYLVLRQAYESNLRCLYNLLTNNGSLRIMN